MLLIVCVAVRGKGDLGPVKLHLKIEKITTELFKTTIVMDNSWKGEGASMLRWKLF